MKATGVGDEEALALDLLLGRRGAPEEREPEGAWSERATDCRDGDGRGPRAPVPDSPSSATKSTASSTHRFRTDSDISPVPATCFWAKVVVIFKTLPKASKSSDLSGLGVGIGRDDAT